MYLDINEDERRLLVTSLRVNEKFSRNGFNRWYRRHHDGIDPEVLEQKRKRAEAVFQLFIHLRQRLGDTEPIQLPYEDET